MLTLQKWPKGVPRVFVFLGLKSQEKAIEGGTGGTLWGYCHAQRQKSEASWVSGLPFALPQPDTVSA